MRLVGEIEHNVELDMIQGRVAKREVDLAKQTDFWRKALAGSPSLLELPTDRPRLDLNDSATELLDVQLNAALTEQLKGLCERSGVTLHMALLASWAAVLSRLSNQTEVVIGSPFTDRDRVDGKSPSGFFENTLAIRTSLDTDQTVAELLQHVRRQLIEARENHDVLFDDLVDALNLPRRICHAPIFQTMFAWQDPIDDGPLMPRSDDLVEDSSVVPSDLMLSLRKHAMPGSNEPGASASELTIVGGLHFKSALFDRETMVRYCGYWIRLLHAWWPMSPGRSRACPYWTNRRAIVC